MSDDIDSISLISNPVWYISSPLPSQANIEGLLHNSWSTYTTTKYTNSALMPLVKTILLSE